MRTRWKMLTVGRASALGIGLALSILVHSEVSGEPGSAQTASPDVGVPADYLPNPFVQGDPGASGIPYERLGAIEKKGVDHIRQRSESSQPDTSYLGFAAASDWSSSYTERQLAARSVGLVGVEQDGVVP